MRSTVTVLALTSILIGCGGGGGTSGSSFPDLPPAVDMVGRWEGEYGSPLPPRGLTMEILSQDAVGDFSGTWANSLGSFGPITGSVRGDQVEFHISGRNNVCEGEGDGQGTLNLTGPMPLLDFVVSGYDCTGSYPPLLGLVEKQ